MENTAFLLVEIGCEELPPAQVSALARDFPQQLLCALRHAGFANADSRCVAEENAPVLLATPRRFAALLADISAVAAQSLVCRRGPALAACYDAQGSPTKALHGFMQSVGISDPDQLIQIENKGRLHIAYNETRGGGTLAEALAAIVENVLLAVNAPRLMRWADNEFKFIRPLRSALMLHGDTPLPGTILGITAADYSIGHPALAQKKISVPDAMQYEQTLLEHGSVIVNINKRRQAITAQFNDTLANDALTQATLLDEVTAMCEYPAVYTGKLDDAFLSLPAFCIEECMIKHQRAFPIYQDGALSSAYCFITDNRPAAAEKMINGFNIVLRARLRDVEFYLAEDSKLSLEDALNKLEHIVYHRKLGSQRQRVARLCRLTDDIGGRLHLNNAQQQHLQQAAEICKSDLPTLMIGEYPELEGQIAALYFCRDAPAVAQLVRCHNRRDWRAAAAEAGDIQTLRALLLTIQLEKLVGLFAAGEKPTGSKDPHGLRQAAAIAADIMSDGAAEIAINDALSAAADVFTELPPFDLAEVGEFITERKRQELLEGGVSAAVLNAVLAQPPLYLSDIAQKAAALGTFLNLPAAAALIEAHKRINNILRKSAAADIAAAINPALLCESAERNLYNELTVRQSAAKESAAQRDYAAVLSATAAMRESVDTFFTQVLVNTDDKKIRNNRLALLRLLHDFFNTVGDLSKLSGGMSSP